MPFMDATKIILDQETKELKDILENNAKAKETFNEFEAECKLRRELAEVRKQKSMTQKELQEKTGLTQQTISRIESNNDISPSLTNLIKYVNAIGCELTVRRKKGEDKS